jgi:hypothetical protein
MTGTSGASCKDGAASMSVCRGLLAKMEGCGLLEESNVRGFLGRAREGAVQKCCTAAGKCCQSPSV